MIEHKIIFYFKGDTRRRETRIPVKKWDVAKALKAAREFGSIPFAFRFITIGDGQPLNVSGVHYLGGARLKTLPEKLKGLADRAIKTRDGAVMAFFENDKLLTFKP